MKYDRYWPRIFGLNACAIFFYIFFRKRHQTSHSVCVITSGSPIPNMKATHENLLLIDTNLVEAETRWNEFFFVKKTEKNS